MYINILILLWNYNNLFIILTIILFMISEYFDNMENNYFQEAFDEVYELIDYITLKPTDEDITELQQYFQIVQLDESISKILIELFQHIVSVKDIRVMSRNNYFEDVNVDIKIVYDKLKHIYEDMKVENKNILTYLLFLLFEPMKYIENLYNKLISHGFSPVNNTIKDLLSIGKVQKIYDGKTCCVLSYICISDIVPHVLFQPHYAFATFKNNISDNNYFDNMIESAINSVTYENIMESINNAVEEQYGVDIHC